MDKQTSPFDAEFVFGVRCIPDIAKHLLSSLVKSGFTAFVVISLLMTISPRVAAAGTDSIYWDCWIEDNNVDPTSINCIRDFDSPVYKPAQGGSKAELEEVLLKHIHEQIHAGNTTEIGKFIRSNVEVFGRNSIWGISIYSEPYETSWDEGRPETLVRALLCPRNVACTVMINRPK